MPHIPYGYKIEKGAAVIDQEASARVKELYRIYLSGLSLSNAAKEAGIKGYHSTIAKMLTNKRYLGDGYYPQIIDKGTFEQAEAERLRRAKMLGRIREGVGKKKSLKKYSFSMEKPEQLYDDPFKQAEYVYSLIESEVIEDGNE
ncbi:recombinase family protein [Proteinivorax tanatarense]|uniref:Recombinase family protein n=1 Tax=Proteinivorax tanatarense TaxID=1260629 RepID=A0AAU7VK86_9FIRM